MSVISRMASFDDDIPFRRLWRYGLVLSAVLVTVSIGTLLTRGLNLGIDFEGGTSWEVPAPGVSISEARDALRPLGQENAKIQIVGDDTVRVQADPTDEERRDEVTVALADLAGVDDAEVGVSTVGPTWGDEISEKAQRALFFVLAGIAIWIAIRLEWKMAVGALTAVVHDVLITVGVYSAFQFEVTPATVIAFLTILGYSVYDTVVVFDKVSENASRSGITGKMTYTDVMSLSMNQVLMRSLNTTITSALPVLAMLVVGSFMLGAVTLQEFAVALVVGLVVGAYSSIFVAAPVVAAIKEREPEYRTLRSRLATSAERKGEPAPAGVTSAPSGDASAPPLSGRPIPPRPRKKGKRR